MCRQVTTSVKLKKNMLESVIGLPQAVELVPAIVVFCLNGKTGLEKVQSLYLAALEVKAFQPSAESAVVKKPCTPQICHKRSKHFKGYFTLGVAH